MPLSPATEPRYRPRPAKNQLKQIVEDSLEDLLRVWDERFREWDPPWKRPRKARGPPPSYTQGQGSRPCQPAEEDWLEGTDPPHPPFDLDPPFEDGRGG